MILLALALACTTEVPPECFDHGDCDEEQACISNHCEVVDCLSDDACAFGELCSAEFTCDPGCNTDADCNVGEACEVESCVPAACTDTITDCALGEICDEASGACTDSDPVLCAECEVSDPDSCGPYGLCVQGSSSPHGYCMPICNLSSGISTCPQGSSCMDLAQGTACWAPCSTYEDAGYL